MFYDMCIKKNGPCLWIDGHSTPQKPFFNDLRAQMAIFLKLTLIFDITTTTRLNEKTTPDR